MTAVRIAPMFRRLARLVGRPPRSTPDLFRDHPSWVWAAVEAGLDAVGLADADGVVRAWASPNGLGGNGSDSVGRPTEEMIHPDDRAAAVSRLAELIRRPDAAESLVCRLRHATGGWRPAELRAANRLHREDVRAMVLAARDVSGWSADRPAAGGFRALPDPALTIAPDWRVTDMNPAAERQFGRPRAAVVGKSLWIAFPGLPGSPFEKWLREAVSAGRAAGGQGFVAESGQWLEARAVPAAGGLTIIFHDVTDRRRLEDQLRQAQKLDTVGRLAGGIAHDLNNLLTAAGGSARTALADLPDGSEAAEWVAETVRATDRAAALTRKLLAVGRRQPDGHRPLDLNAVVGGMADLLRRVLGERVELALDQAADLHPIAGDPGALEQLVLNLCVNARDAMPGGGTLRLSTRNAGPNAVELVAADTGTGMSAEVRSRLFEPFFTTKPADQGSGLGLAVVAGVAAEHGGRVDVESVPGAGTTFRVWLPRTAGTPAPVAVPTEDTRPLAAPAGRPTVLLAEDDDGVRAVTAHTLRAAGYEVLACPSGESAADVARGHLGRVDILVTDVVMPGLGGPELATAVTAMHPEAAVLFVSGYSADLLPVAAVNGRVAVLEKPYTPAALSRAVRALVTRSAAETTVSLHTPFPR